MKRLTAERNLEVCRWIERHATTGAMFFNGHEDLCYCAGQMLLRDGTVLRARAVGRDAEEAARKVLIRLQAKALRLMSSREDVLVEDKPAG